MRAGNTWHVRKITSNFFLWLKQIVCVVGKMIRSGFVALIRDQTTKNTTGRVKESEFKGQSGNHRALELKNSRLSDHKP